MFSREIRRSKYQTSPIPFRYTYKHFASIEKGVVLILNGDCHEIYIIHQSSPSFKRSTRVKTWSINEITNFQTSLTIPLIFFMKEGP
jgi:hypothetical protein